MIPHVRSLLFDVDVDTTEEQETQEQVVKSAIDTAVAKTQRLVRAASATVSLGIGAHLAQLTHGHDDLVAAAQALGFTVRLRDCVGGGAGAACLQNLRHSFLILSPHTHTSSEIIIDPTFRDQFTIAAHSARYAAVLDALPPVFMGTPSSVQPLVEHLCSEMALAFAAAGSVVPPWRSTRSMMTKWMPRRSLDLPLTSTAVAASGLAAAPTAATPLTPVASTQPGSGGSSRRGAAANNKNRLLRQACSAAEAAAHPGGCSSRSTASDGMQPASDSSSNCSSNSSSAGAPHTALLLRAADEGSIDNSDSSSPTVLTAAAAAAAAAPAGGSGLKPRSGVAIAGAAAVRAVPAPAAGGVSKGGVQGAICFEPLHRVVGGFAFSPTPL